MHLPRGHAQVVRQALDVWKSSGMLTTEQAAKLDSSIVVQPFDWQRLAKYSFWVAIVCAVTAIGAVVADYSSPIVHLCELSTLATGFFVWGHHWRQDDPQQQYSIESIYLLGVVSTAAAVERLGVVLGNRAGRTSFLVLLSCLIYLGVAMMVQSSLIWVCGILALSGWFGAETGYVSGSGLYYLGMNYPLRFIPFGCALIAASYGCRFVPRVQGFERSTLACGLLDLFIACWIMSLTGNSSRRPWHMAKHWELFQWSVLFAAVAAGAIYHGLKMDDGMTRGFGITFLGINLYTRYFEYFWGTTHKAVFFTLLGVSFWWIGSKAETIWQFRRGTPTGS